MSDNRAYPHLAMVNWPNEPNGRYHQGWFVGSEAEDGTHLRDASGWPYSVYRKGREPGTIDACICIGIQSRVDADAIVAALDLATAALAWQEASVGDRDSAATLNMACLEYRRAAGVEPKKRA